VQKRPHHLLTTWRGMSRRAAMLLLPSPWLARSTILARTTSRYGDVYSLDQATNSARSFLVRSITYGLFLGTIRPPGEGEACQKSPQNT